MFCKFYVIFNYKKPPAKNECAILFAHTIDLLKKMYMSNCPIIFSKRKRQKLTSKTS